MSEAPERGWAFVGDPVLGGTQEAGSAILLLVGASPSRSGPARKFSGPTPSPAL